MSRDNLKETLINIPTRFCRKMSYQFIQNVLEAHTTDLSPHHFMILRFLSESGRSYMTEMVDSLTISRPQMTASADKLISLGYVSRVSDDNDRRKIYLVITERGKTLVGQINREIGQRVDEVLLRLSSQEIVVLEKGLEVFEKLCAFCAEMDNEKRF
jgi:DNA-binding MarR family transcriptional regulator